MNMGVFVINIICRMIENVVLTVGIVYASIHFERFSLLWFLLIPACRGLTYQSSSHRTNDEKEEEE